MSNDGGQKQKGGVYRPGRTNGFIPNSFRTISGYLKIVSSGASSVARSAASVASSFVERDDETNHDQVIWALFDTLEFELDVTRRALLLGYHSGFQVWDVEEADNVRDLASQNCGPVSFMQVLPKPLASRRSEDKFVNSRPLLVVCTDGNLSAGNNFQNGQAKPSNGAIPNCYDPANGSFVPTVVSFYSLKSQSFVYNIKFRSTIYAVRCSPQVIAISLAAQIHCINSSTLKKDYSILTNPIVPGRSGFGGIGYGPLAVGPRWLAYSGSPVVASNSGRVNPQHVTPSAPFFGFSSNGSLVAHYTKESSKQIAAGIITLGDMGYKTLSRYCSELLPDSNNLQSGSPGWKVNGTVNRHMTDAENVGMVIVRDIVSKVVIAQFRAHKSPISALCFDPTGTLLVTASVQGHNINVFKIMPVFSGSSSIPNPASSYVHLYRLQRGFTNAVIQDISFSYDSNWIMISSSRGTSHLFAINPMGGIVDPFAADASLTTKNGGLAAMTSTPVRWPPVSGSEMHKQQGLCTAGSAVTLSAVSRIRNGNSSWKGAVSGTHTIDMIRYKYQFLYERRLVKLCDNSIDSPIGTDDERSTEKELIIPWFPDLSSQTVSLRRKEVFRERKQKWIFKNSHDIRFGRLVDMCAKNIGTEATFAVLGKIGRQTGVKEYNVLINICMEKARSSVDEEVALEQFHKALRLFESMKDQGFSLEEETYGPFLAYLIDKGMVEEFHYIIGVIKGENHNSIPRLGYYEMLLWIKVNNEEKIQVFCDWMMTDHDENKSSLQENYLLALYECDRKKEVSQLLEIIDITKFSSMHSIARLFEFLGKQLLESLAEKFLVAFKASELEAENITDFIYSYAVGIPNLTVEDAISKYKDLHSKLELTPSCASYHKLVTYCCDSCKVHLALDLVNELCEMGFTLSTETLHTILLAVGTNTNFNLVRQIYAMIGHHNLKVDEETFRMMIHLSVRMKDFAGAYNFLNDLKEVNIKPTSSMYNAIMGGYFREYYEEVKLSGVQVTKHIYMSLVNAYTAIGQYKKAKQVVLDNMIPVKSLNEIKSALVQALASHGQLSDALSIYREIKQAGYSLEPKAVISLIEHLDFEGNLSTLLQLLGELEDLDYWIDGCCRVISYCVRFKHLSSVIALLKQIKDKVEGNEYAMEAILNEVFSLIGDLESSHLQIGMDLLEFVKNVCNLTPPRKCLDFLLHACINAKDLENGKLIWKEYEAAGFPYNVLSFLSMYRVLLAAGDVKAAKSLLAKIPKDDPHVRFMIKAFQTAYISFKETTKTRTKKDKEKR